MIKELQTQLRQAKTDCENVKRDNKKLQAQHEQYEKMLDKYKQQTANNQELVLAQRDIRSLEAKIARQKRKKEDLKIKMNNMQEELQSSMAQKELVTKENEKLIQQLNESQHDQEVLKQRIQEHLNEVSSREVEISEF